MNESKHILSSFDRELSVLNQGLMTMASVTLQNLNHAKNGLLNRDLVSCNQCIAEDETVDTLEKKVDADGIAILTKFSPLAKDLRLVMSTMKVSNNLERISDQAVNVARRAKRLIEVEPIDELQELQNLFDEAIHLLQEALAAFRNHDIELAQTLKAKDKSIDKLQNDFIDKMMNRVQENPTLAKAYMDLIFVARFLERVGDHAVNIGEDAVYATIAEDIRHLSAKKA